MPVANTTIPVLTLGSTVTLLGVTRSLGRKHIPQYCLTPARDFVQWSRWYRELESVQTPPTPETLESFLAASDLEKAVLLPCSDNWAKAVASLPNSLRERFPASISRSEVLDVFTDKEKFRELLSSCAVPHPQTIPLNSRRDLESVPESFFKSAFLKPRKSQEFFKQYAVKGFTVPTRELALEKFDRVSHDGHALVLQEYVSGPATNHYFIDGFVDRTGKIRALFPRQRLRMYPPDFGNSSIMVSVPLSEVAQAVDTLRTIFAKSEYRGIFSAEFKRDAHDGLFKILEVNARAWWYVEFATRCGVDVCEMSYHDALGQAVADCPSYLIGKRCVYWYYDMHACRDAIAAGELTWGNALRDWVSAQHSLFVADDPGPACWGFVQQLKNRLLLNRGLKN